MTIEQIYKPLAKSEGKILDLAKSSKDEFGKPGDKIHQFLSEVGVKALKQQIGKVLAVTTLFDEKDATNLHWKSKQVIINAATAPGFIV